MNVSTPVETSCSPPRPVFTMPYGPGRYQDPIREPCADIYDGRLMVWLPKSIVGYAHRWRCRPVLYFLLIGFWAAIKHPTHFEDWEMVVVLAIEVFGCVTLWHFARSFGRFFTVYISIDEDRIVRHGALTAISFSHVSSWKRTRVLDVKVVPHDRLGLPNARIELRRRWLWPVHLCNGSIEEMECLAKAMRVHMALESASVGPLGIFPPPGPWKVEDDPTRYAQRVSAAKAHWSRFTAPALCLASIALMTGVLAFLLYCRGLIDTTLFAAAAGLTFMAAGLGCAGAFMTMRRALFFPRYVDCPARLVWHPKEQIPVTFGLLSALFFVGAIGGLGEATFLLVWRCALRA